MAHDDSTCDSIFCGAVEIASSADRAAFIARGMRCRRRSCVTASNGLIDAHFQAGSFLESPAASATLSAELGPVDRWLRYGHRPVQAAPDDRRGGHGHGLHGRADPARAADRSRSSSSRPAWTAARSSPGSGPNARPWP